MKEISGDPRKAPAAATRQDDGRLELPAAEPDALMHLKSCALNLVSDAAYLIDQNACFVYVNEEACRTLGYSEAQLLRMRVMDVDPEWNFERWRDAWKELRENGSMMIESMQRRQDGTTLPVEISASYFEYEGQPYNLALVRDITERKRTEQLLIAQLELEAQFRRLAESTPDIICRYDLDCRLVYANSGLAAILRRPLHEMLGATPTEHTADPQFVAYQNALAATLETGAERTHELTLRDGANDVSYHHVRILAERGLHDEITSVLALGRDITERKKAEERLHASGQAFRALVEHSPDYIARFDRDCRRIYANPALRAILPPVADEAMGSESVDESPVVDVPRYRDQLRRVVETGTERMDEVRFRNANGEVRWGHMRMVPEFAADGQVATVLAICRDIDELKRSEQLFRTLTENAPEMIVRYDRNCRYSYVNPRFEQVNGMRAADAIDKAPAELSDSVMPELRMITATLEQVMASGIGAKVDLTSEKNGKPVGWHVSAVPEHGANGDIRGALTIWTDITERMEAELRLRESYALLQELTSLRETAREEERKRIAREMHDELGQQLTALRLGVSAMRIEFAQDDPALAGRFRDLLALADDTMQVVRNVVASLRPAAIDAGIVAALEWLAAEFSRDGRVACHLRIPDDSLVLDEARAIALFRIVQEALTNVARHAAATQVTISLEQTGRCWVLEISDDGCGFDSMAARMKSFGLVGMRERVLMLGGEISVRSAPGSGTSITVRIPVDDAS
ncbi:PAS domain S-box-containing protein [Paraburkholderia sp. BL18I3N2]|nr:PAS domain S-box-containing protein [Paraburkholderia sp. BL18I3N2]